MALADCPSLIGQGRGAASISGEMGGTEWGDVPAQCREIRTGGLTLFFSILRRCMGRPPYTVAWPRLEIAGPHPPGPGATSSRLDVLAGGSRQPHGAVRFRRLNLSPRAACGETNRRRLNVRWTVGRRYRSPSRARLPDRRASGRGLADRRRLMARARTVGLVVSSGRPLHSFGQGRPSQSAASATSGFRWASKASHKA